MTRARWVVALLVIMIACGARQQPRDVAPDHQIRVIANRIQLRNGLVVIVLPDPHSPLVEVDVRYATGGADDPATGEGLAHVVEHMTFRARPAGPEGPSIMALLRDVTLASNAYTDYDYTHYTNLARREQVDFVLAIEAARMRLGCDTISASDFARERQVVRNELALREENPADAYLFNDLYGDGHPYARSIAGSQASLTAVTAADACRFHAEHYTPSTRACKDRVRN